MFKMQYKNQFFIRTICAPNACFTNPNTRNGLPGTLGKQKSPGFASGASKLRHEWIGQSNRRHALKRCLNRVRDTLGDAMFEKVRIPKPESPEGNPNDQILNEETDYRRQLAIWSFVIRN